MLLKELQIEGFRSLRSVTWKPGRLNVLIGPNGGGKSNLLRLLDLLRISATGGLRDAVIGMGGLIPLLWDGVSREICIRSELDRPPKPAVHYGLDLQRLGNTGEFVLANEKLRILDGVRSLGFPDLMGDARVALEEGETDTMLSRSHRFMPLGRPPQDHPAAVLFETKRFFSGCEVHFDMRVDQSAELRRTAIARSEKRVSSDGQNLIAVLHTLYSNDRNFEEFLDKAMSAAFPDDYDKLIFPPAEHGRIEMRVRRKHRKGTDSPADLSDGTLRFLLLATILGSTDPAPLIAIDEPEAGLHPRMMSIVAEIAANAATKSQVIFSTHSPEFLDAFRPEPPTVTVVTSNGSETELRTVGGDDLKKWVQDYSLGKFAFSGEAEAVL